LGRPQSLETAVRQFPESVSAVVGSSIAVVGTVAAVGIARRPGAARLPLAVLAASYAGWLVLGIAGLPLLLRYAMLPGAAMLVAAAASGPLVAGWVRGRSRSAAAVVWLISGAAVATQLADATSAIRQQVRGGELQLAMERDLDAVLVDPRVRALVARCGAPTVPHYRPVPQIAYRLGVPADRPLVAAGDMSPVLLDPIPSRASAAYRLSPIDRDAFAADAILGTRLVMANGHWAVRERCTVR
jgi:hypothetical protein